MKQKNTYEIMHELDAWVSRHGNGKYFEPFDSLRVSIVNSNEIPGQILEEHGIQQVRNEIGEFVIRVLFNGMTNCILEIGLGRFGSTHFLWRQFFDRVVSIEKNFERVRDFGRRTKEYYGKWILDDGKSFFIDGLSNDTAVVMNTYKLLHGGIDVLFIDGDHSYQGVLTDWLLYSPLVKPGGIVAFHDSMYATLSGAPKLLTELEDGAIDGKTRTITQILKSDMCGIGYYIND